MACRNCGHENPPEAPVCAECGADLSASREAAAEAATAAATLRAAQDAQTPAPVAPGNGRLVTIIAVIAALALLALCATIAVYNVVALQQLRERSARRNAILQQRAVPAPNTIGQTDEESGTSEPDTDETGSAAGQTRVAAPATPEAVVAAWYEALRAADPEALKRLVTPTLAAQADAKLATSANVTDFRITSVTTTGAVSRITVDQTAATVTVARFTVSRSAHGVWLITSLQ